MPPDAVKERPNYTEKIDCFSFGVLGVQILTRLFPQPGDRYCAVSTPSWSGRDSPVDLVQAVPEVERRRNHLGKISHGHPLLDLLLKCLKDNEPDRPTAIEICRYVAELRDIEVYESERRSRSSSLSCGVTTGSEAMLNRRLKATVESCEATIEQLTGENRRKDEEITRLEREKAELLQISSIPSQVNCVIVMNITIECGGTGYIIIFPACFFFEDA